MLLLPRLRSAGGVVYSGSSFTSRCKEDVDRAGPEEEVFKEDEYVGLRSWAPLTSLDQRGRRRVLDLCVNDASGPSLRVSLLVVSGVPETSPMDRGWARDAVHRIRSRRMERVFRCATGNRKMFSAVLWRTLL
jgi:hypothetical protein